MRIQLGENLSFPEWDLNEDLLSEGVEVKKPMEIASLAKNMKENWTNKLQYFEKKLKLFEKNFELIFYYELSIIWR